MGTGTTTSSYTDTFSESNAKYVLGKIYDDFNGVIFRGFTSRTKDKLKAWRDDVAYVMMKNALKSFEIQFSYNFRNWAVCYTVNSKGEIVRDDDSGGLDFHSIHEDASINIVMYRDENNSEVTEYLRNQGWFGGGSYLTENSSVGKAYSKEGFGVTRKTLGDI